jgi:PAS domain S-box-containing protein
MGLQDIPIKRQVMAVIMLTSATVLVLTGLAFMISDLLSFRQRMVENLATIASIIADQSTAALDFRTEKEAQEILGSLRAEPHIVAAALYDSQDQIFVRYPAGKSISAFPVHSGRTGHRFEPGRLVFFVPVAQEENRLGTLYLVSDLGALYSRLRLYGASSVAVLIGSALVALLISTALQKRITQPILALAQVARVISERRDYSVRAPKVRGNELGLLTDAFNQMLSRIHEQTLALTESEGRKSAILESAIDCIITMNQDGKIVDFNPAAEKLFGRRRESVIGQTVADTIIPARLRSAHWAGLARFKESGQSQIVGRRIELPALRSDGTEVPVELAISSTPLPGGAVLFTAYLRDITERRRAEQSQSFLASIVGTSDDAIIGKDLTGTVVSWNDGATRIFGYSAEEMIGQPVSRLVSPDRPEEEEGVLGDVRQGVIRHFETVRIRKDGQPLNVSLTLSPIKNTSGQIIGISSIARDISERKQAEERIRELNAQLEQRVRERTRELTAANRELEAFTYSVAHDLRAPLRHIDAFTRILREDFAEALPQDAKGYLDNICKSSRNMSLLVNDLLNLASVGRKELKRQITPLEDLVEEVVKDLRGDTQGRAIKWEIQPLPVVRCDAGLMKLVFVNLLSNAVKYTRPRPLATISVGFHTDQGEGSVFVRDNGVGFDMKYSDKLFGVFSRLHRAEDFEGTGVGLATVERIVRKHGGRVWAEAAVDKGATFYFTMAGLGEEHG